MEAVSEFPELSADTIRANFEEIFQHNDQAVLNGFLRMELAAKQEPQAYQLKLVRMPPPEQHHRLAVILTR